MHSMQEIYFSARIFCSKNNGNKAKSVPDRIDNNVLDNLSK